MQLTVWSKSFTVFSREVFVEMTSLPLAKGMFPSTFKAPEGSRVILWWRFAIILSPSSKKKETTNVSVEDRKTGETLQGS